jgi:dipeptidase
VFLAHNEDDGGKRIVNWYKVPRKKSKQKDSITLKRGRRIAQVNKTYSYLWLEIPELEFSDSYINETGLTIASDACRSREDQAVIVNGGIGYWLRRLMIERAKTAREAVQVAGELIESIGYASSGRTYCIADSNEAWMLSVVKGKHWVARRIPDNEVAIIPNYYTIDKVDLSDNENYMGSSDLISYAIKRGWYDPQKDGEFSFRKAYSNQKNLKNIVNIARHWVSLNALSEKKYSLNEDFPFSFKPKKKIELKDLFTILRNHYEKTDFDLSIEHKGNPHHQKTMSVCSNTNQYGFVAQLRAWMPSEIGDIFWIAPRRPCVQAFRPIYSGVITAPKDFAVYDAQTAIIKHFDKIESYKTYTEKHAYQLFYNQANQIDADYTSLILKRQKKLFRLENKLLKKQNKFEKKMLKCFKKKPKKVRKKLARYSYKYL